MYRAVRSVCFHDSSWHASAEVLEIADLRIRKKCGCIAGLATSICVAGIDAGGHVVARKALDVAARVVDVAEQLESEEATAKVWIDGALGAQWLGSSSRTRWC